MLQSAVGFKPNADGCCGHWQCDRDATATRCDTYCLALMTNQAFRGTMVCQDLEPKFLAHQSLRIHIVKSGSSFFSCSLRLKKGALRSRHKLATCPSYRAVPGYQVTARYDCSKNVHYITHIITHFAHQSLHVKPNLSSDAERLRLHLATLCPPLDTVIQS